MELFKFLVKYDKDLRCPKIQSKYGSKNIIQLSASVFVGKFRTLYSIPFLPKFCFLYSYFLKYLSGKANSVDLDQTAPSGAVWSGSALFAYAILLATLVYEIYIYQTYCWL